MCHAFFLAGLSSGETWPHAYKALVKVIVQSTVLLPVDNDMWPNFRKPTMYTLETGKIILKTLL